MYNKVTIKYMVRFMSLCDQYSIVVYQLMFDGCDMFVPASNKP